MAGADGVDVGALHLQKVGAHVVLGDIVAGFRIVVVTVDALDEDRLAVVEELAVLDLIAAETDLAA
jgi:hypothetical protein